MIAWIRTCFLTALLVLSGIATISLTGVGNAQAQDITESHLEAARNAVTATRSTAAYDVLLPNLGERAKQQLITNRPDAADQISIIVDEATIGLAARRGDLEQEIARIYATIFTEEELVTINEFYRSETGRKLIRETPGIARAMDQASRVWSAGIQRDLAQEVRKKIEEAGLQ
ncbi:MAG: DUF2059 domain-containing protein [Pseudomonadota bacterium]